MSIDDRMEKAQKAAKGKLVFGDGVKVPTAMKLAGFSVEESKDIFIIISVVRVPGQNVTKLG